MTLTAIGLLVYAVSMETRTQFDLDELSAAGATSGSESVESAPASVWVDGTPYGATLLVNADSVGTVPMTVENLPAGEHLITLEANGQALDTLISVRAGDVAAVFLRLGGPIGGDVAEAIVDVEPESPAGEAAPPPAPQESDVLLQEPQASVPATGLLRVLSQPAGATVRIDGVPVGTTPLAAPDVEAGRRTVSVSLAGHQTREMSVDVAAGRDQMVRFSLAATAGPGTLEVLVQPWGTVYINGALGKRNTDVVYRTELPAGTHEVRVVHPTFGTRTRQVTVRAGQSVMEVFDLTEGTTGSGS